MSSVNVETTINSRVDGFQGVAKVTYLGSVDSGRTVESPVFSSKEGAQDWCTSLRGGEVVGCQFDEADPKAQDTFSLDSYKAGLDSQNAEPETKAAEEGGEEQPVDAPAPEAPADEKAE